tara:strand:+ start:9878 stop:10801 length:924 start_codon:yes stop_codon:yes gene_type:complete
MEILTFEYLRYLQAHALVNIDYYINNNFVELPKHQNGFTRLRKDIDISKIRNLDIEKNKKGEVLPAETDRKNAQIIYDTLIDLTPAEAANAQIWGKLTHYDCNAYLQKRQKNNYFKYVNGGIYSDLDNKLNDAKDRSQKAKDEKEIKGIETEIEAIKIELAKKEKQQADWISRNLTLNTNDCIRYRSKISSLWWICKRINEPEIKDNFDYDEAYKIIFRDTDVPFHVFGRPVVSSFNNLLLGILRVLKKNPNFHENDRHGLKELMKSIGREFNAYDIHLFSDNELEDKLSLMYEKMPPPKEKKKTKK